MKYFSISDSSEESNFTLEFFKKIGSMLVKWQCFIYAVLIVGAIMLLNLYAFKGAQKLSGILRWYKKRK